MKDMIRRRSPVSFDRQIRTIRKEDGWIIVLEYEAEGSGPHLIDLSHRPRWDVQDRDLAAYKPWGITIPPLPCMCTYARGVLINRMNRTQASIWHLTGETMEPPDDPAFTGTTDATLLLALVGEHVFSITEKLTTLDLSDPSMTTPLLFQGPFSHVPSQIVVLEKSEKCSGILLTCSRGYARDMVSAICDAGDEFGLRPAGENTFTSWTEGL